MSTRQKIAKLIVIMLIPIGIMGQVDLSTRNKITNPKMICMNIRTIDNNIDEFRYFLINEQSKENKNIHFGDIMGQLGAGVVGGVLLSLPSMAIAGALSKNSDYFIVGGLIGYTIGNSLAVYIVADKDKYDPNFLYLISSSVIGVGIGAWLYYVSDQSGFLSGAPLYLPPLFTILTLNLFNQKKNNIKLTFNLKNTPIKNEQYYSLKIHYNF